MSVVPLQTRILEVIREHSPVPVKELGRWLPDIERNGLDCAITALMRANKVSRIGGYYDLIGGLKAKTNGADHASGQSVEVAGEAGNLQAARPPESRPSEAKAVEPDRSAPPTAAEEVAANLNGQPQLFDCERCHVPQPDNDFPHSKLGTRFKVCRRCNAQLRNPSINGGSGECALPSAASSLAAAPTPTATSDPILAKLRDQEAELTDAVREYEQILDAKRLALEQVRAVLTYLEGQFPEAFA